jgi:bacteriorhodopsin
MVVVCLQQNFDVCQINESQRTKPALNLALTRKDLGTDLVWGAKRGALLALVFCAVLGLTMIVRGRAAYVQTSFLRLVVVTIGFGIAGGLSVGLVRPLTRRHWGALTVGFLGGFMSSAFCLLLIFGTAGLREITPRVAIGLTLASIVVGLRAAAMVGRPASKWSGT